MPSRQQQLLHSTKAYQELFKRHLDAWAERNVNKALGKMDDNEIRDMLLEVVEELRIELQLEPEANDFFKNMILTSYFGKTKQTWSGNR